MVLRFEIIHLPTSEILTFFRSQPRNFMSHGSINLRPWYRCINEPKLHLYADRPYLPDEYPHRAERVRTSFPIPFIGFDLIWFYSGITAQTLLQRVQGSGLKRSMYSLAAVCLSSPAFCT